MTHSVDYPFVDGSKPNVKAYWLNLVDSLVFDIFASSTSLAQVQTILGIPGGGPWAHAGANSDITSLGICTSISTGAAVALSLLTSGGKQVEIAHVASAVNYLSLRGSTAGNAPQINVFGTDTNVSLSLFSKGTGGFNFATGGGTQVSILDTAAAVNSVQLRGGPTTIAPFINFTGSDATVAGTIFWKGSAALTFYSNSQAAAAPQFRIRGDATTAANFFDVFGQPAGTAPILRAEGSDTNIGVAIFSKGTGTLQFGTGQGARNVLILPDTASSVNYCQIQGSGAGVPIGIKPVGGDTNVILALSGRGASGCRLQSGDFSRIILEAIDVASSVNYIQINPNTTGNPPGLYAAGTDTNVDVLLSSKGTGGLTLRTGSAARTGLSLVDVASSVNFIQLSPSTTGNPTGLKAAGTDTNITLALSSKGTNPTDLQTGDFASTGFRVINVASSVNFLQAAPSATGVKPTLSVIGTDTDIGMIFQVKGTTLDASEFSFLNGSGTKMVEFDQLTGTVATSFILRAGTTGIPPAIISVGSDTNIGLAIVPKGTGLVNIQGITSGLQIEGASVIQNSQSTAYTLVASDANKHILHPSADTTARTFTIPANSSVAFAIGTDITFVNQNAAGVLTIAITTDTMRLAGPGTTGSRTLAANGIATALKITATEWIISGTGLT